MRHEHPERRPVLRPDLLPVSPVRGFWAGAVVWLVLDRLNLPGWANGVLWTLFAFAFIGLLVKWATQKHASVSEVLREEPGGWVKR